MTKTNLILAAGLAFLTACANPMTLPAVGRLLQWDQGNAEASATPPEGAPPGTCWARDVTPAVVETVTEQIMVQPSQVTADGTVQSPGAFRSVTHQKIVQERRELYFETPCLTQMTPEFIASLQRALTARGIYRGAADGVVSPNLRQSIRKYQRQVGHDSAILAMSSARELGLIAYARDPG